LGWITALWEHCCALQAFSVLRVGVDGAVVCLDGGQRGVWVMVGLSGMVWDSWYMVDKSHLVDEDNKYEVYISFQLQDCPFSFYLQPSKSNG
jgi:hypothetical protein